MLVNDTDDGVADYHGDSRTVLSEVDRTVRLKNGVRTRRPSEGVFGRHFG